MKAGRIPATGSSFILSDGQNLPASRQPSCDPGAQDRGFLEPGEEEGEEREKDEDEEEERGVEGLDGHAAPLGAEHRLDHPRDLVDEGDGAGDVV